MSTAVVAPAPRPPALVLPAPRRPVDGEARPTARPTGSTGSTGDVVQDVGDDVGDVLVRAVRGDAHAWTQLHRRFDGLVRSVARRHRLGASDVDEVSQRTWLRLFEHARSVRDPHCLPGWIRTTAQRECLALQRDQWRQQPVADLHETHPGTVLETALDGLLTAELASALHDAVRSLPAHQRRVLEALLALPDASYAELSARLGVPVGSIGPTRQRALRRLRELLAPYDDAVAA